MMHRLSAARRHASRSGPIPAAELHGALSSEEFAARLDHHLGMLSAFSTNVALFAVEAATTGSTAIETAIVEALVPLGSVGRLPDGRIGLVRYAGSRGGEFRAENLRHYLRERLTHHLGDCGWARAAEVRVAGVHSWTDCVGDAGDLIAALPEARPEPRPEH
ncbi:MAG: hypothetical protein GC191_04620 [Azospirillum sp.]|nr:hypothetical protein [Azospirillum sp.]